MNVDTLKEQILQNDALFYPAIAVIILTALITYFFIIRTLQKRKEQRQKYERQARQQRFQQAIDEDAKAREAKQNALREELLRMNEDAFKRYKKQRGYTYQHYLDVAFNKDDDPEHLFLYHIEEQRKLDHFLSLQSRLQSHEITSMDEKELREIERKYPYGITFELKDAPTDIDRIKNDIGQRAADELKRRGKL